MLNRKGQGLTEYGIILLLVVLIGSGVWFGGGLGGDVQGMYSTIGAKLQSIIGDDSSIYDTDIIKQAFNRYGDGDYKKIDAHLTNITVKGKTIYWYEGGNGKKVYDYYYPGKGGTVDRFRYNISVSTGIQTLDFGDGTRGGFFKADNGYIYKVSVSGTGSDISDVSIVPYTGSVDAKVKALSGNDVYTVEGAAEATTKNYFQ